MSISRIEKHPHRDKEQGREGILERPHFFSCPVAMVGFANHYPGKKRSERK